MQRVVFYCTLETHLDIIASLFQHTPTNETFQYWKNLKNDVNITLSIFSISFTYCIFTIIYRYTFTEILLVINKLIRFKIQLKATGPKTLLIERKINFEIE